MNIAGRILLAEDDMANAMVAQELLENLGWEVDIVATGKAVLEKTKTDRYCVVIMGLRLSDMHGLEVARRIREEESQADRDPITLFCVTASVLPGERERCLEAGMNEYLSKPYRLEEFEGKLAALTC